jgi:hypothetical protein
MIDEKTIKLEARLCAIEFAISELFSFVYADVPAKAIHDRHDDWIAWLKRRGVPGLDDPALSDLFSGEAETALRELLTQIEFHVRKPRPQAGG